MDFEIRQATREDADGIAACHVASWESFYREILPPEMIASRDLGVRRKQWAESLSQPNRITFVAYDQQGTVAGFASALINDAADPYDAYLQTLYLTQDHLGKQLGQRLLLALAAEIVRRGGRSMSLRVLRLNRARGFYERLGARTVPGDIPQDAGSFDDVIYAFDDLTELLDRHT